MGCCARIERARDALQQAYHDLGHCSVKVTLARPEPKDGVVTFRLVEIPASEIRDCLPMVVLDEQQKPRAASQAAGARGAMAYPYVWMCAIHLNHRRSRAPARR